MKVFLIFLSFFLVGCSCSGGSNRTDSELVLDMVQQKHIKPQEGGAEGQLQMLLPPEGTKAQNRSYYPYAGDPLKAAKKLKNPLTLTPKTLKKGETYYTKFCIYCHGTAGDSLKGATVAPKMLIKPPSLLTDKVKNYSDGRIYHIIHEGQGLMGSYRIQLGTKEQALKDYLAEEGHYKGSKRIWSVVLYIRSLQRLSEKRDVKE